jgi:hypothetical protein
MHAATSRAENSAQVSSSQLKFVRDSNFQAAMEKINKDYTQAISGNTKGGSITSVDLLFDWFGLVCFANNNKNCQFSYRFQTCQTGGQQNSDTSPFSLLSPYLQHFIFFVTYERARLPQEAFPD